MSVNECTVNECMVNECMVNECMVNEHFVDQVSMFPAMILLEEWLTLSGQNTKYELIGELNTSL